MNNGIRRLAASAAGILASLLGLTWLLILTPWAYFQGKNVLAIFIATVALFTLWLAKSFFARSKKLRIAATSYNRFEGMSSSDIDHQLEIQKENRRTDNLAEKIADNLKHNQ